MTGARTRRITRVAAVLPALCEQLAEHTKDCHQGATFHTSRRELETCWYATPFMMTRDSDALEESNFVVIKQDLEYTDSEGVDVLRFGHWGCGWYEQLYVRRDSVAALRAVQRWLDALADYPIADEGHFSELEWDRNHPGMYIGECYSDDDDCPCNKGHSEYPHEPGRLDSCEACMHECFCTNKPGETSCVFCGEDDGDDEDDEEVPVVPQQIPGQETLW